MVWSKDCANSINISMRIPCVRVILPKLRLTLVKGPNYILFLWSFFRFKFFDRIVDVGKKGVVDIENPIDSHVFGFGEDLCKNKKWLCQTKNISDMLLFIIG